VGGEGRGNWNYKAKCRYKTIGFCVDWDYNTVVRETNVYKDIKYYHFISVILQGYKILSFHFCHFTRILGMESKV
jgi:hypothetical protein